MSRNHQSAKTVFVVTAVFMASAIWLSIPATADENSAPKALRLTPPELSRFEILSLGNSQAPGLEPIKEYGSFFGLKITLKIEGGWNTFSGNDVKRGIMGMYDNGVDYITSTGVTIAENARDAGRGGLEVGGDLIYCLTPRLGIGVGMAGVSARNESFLLYSMAPLNASNFRSSPWVKVSSLRAGVFYSYPFAGFLAISVRGGPAYYSAKYSSAVSSNTGFVRDGLIHMSYDQQATAKKWGFEGGLGFEFTPNPFVAIFLDVQGRTAKIGGLEGNETATFYQDDQYRRSDSSGPVYIIETASNPQLDIIPSSGTVPGGARRATLDFSGVSFLAGLKFRL
jgi:hypothetical protein